MAETNMMIVRWAVGIVAAVALLVLFWWAVPIITRPALDRGYITEREFTPAHTTTVYIPQYSTFCSYNGTTTTCHQQFTHLLPITTHHPDRWALRVENGDREEWITVSESEYGQWAVGAFWTAGPPR